MEKKIEDGGSVFPPRLWLEDRPVGHVAGLTKREWFAAMALQGILSNSNAVNKFTKAVDCTCEVTKDR